MTDEHDPQTDLHVPAVRAMASLAALGCLVLFGWGLVKQGALFPVAFVAGVGMTPLVVRGYRWYAARGEPGQPAWMQSRWGQVVYLVWTFAVVVAVQFVLQTLVPAPLMRWAVSAFVGLTGTVLCYDLGRTGLKAVRG